MNNLYAVVRKAIHADWDPIGVFSLTDELGEYDSYVPGLCKLIEHRASLEEIFKYLWIIETESIGLQGDRRATEKFAKWLHDLIPKDSN